MTVPEAAAAAELAADTWMPPSPLDAVADMRMTAKWILAAAAAVGAALIGGGPLTAVGKVHGIADAALAYAGLMTGVVGIGWAIWYTADALIPPLTTPLSLDREPALRDLRQRIGRDPEAYYGPFGRTMSELRERQALYRKAVRALSEAMAGESDPARRHVMTVQYQQANEALTAIGRRSHTLLELTHAWQVRAQLRRARVHALGGAAVAALGAVLFLAATSRASR